MAKNIDSIVFRVHVVQNLFKVLKTRSVQENQKIVFADFLDRDISDTEFIQAFLGDGSAPLTPEQISSNLNKKRTNSWKENITATSREEYQKYINDTIDIFKKSVDSLATENSTNVTNDFKPVEITDYILKVDNFSSKLDAFSNTLNLTVDMGKSLRNISVDKTVLSIVENMSENDIIVLSYKLPGESNFYIRFIGFITTVKIVEEYGSVSRKTFECAGISKVLGLSSVAIDPAIASFQPTTQLGTSSSVPPMFTNVFTNKTCFEVFKSILNNILFAQEDATTLESLQKSNNLQSFINSLTFRANVLVNIENSLKELKNPNPTSSTTVTHQAKQVSSTNTAKLIKNQERAQKEQSKLFVEAVNSSGIDAVIKTYQLKVNNIVLSTTAFQIIEDLKASAQKSIPLVEDTINFVFSTSALQSALNSRDIHINYSLLLTYGLCVKKLFEDGELLFLNNLPVSGLLGQFDKKIANSVPFDTLLRNGELKIYYSDFQTPEQILSGFRSTLFLDFFEDRPGKIVCRNPRYNQWNNDKSSQNYIIGRENILSYDLSRNDISLKSRSDYKTFTTLVGEQEFTNGNYVDKDIVMKYGFRPDVPRHNPNATTTSAASTFAALDLIKSNSSTRTLSLSVKNNKEYELGNLYFIPEIAVTTSQLHDFRINGIQSILKSISSHPISKLITEKDIKLGHVGYLVEISTTMQPNSVSTHNLSFSLVREAVQIGDYLNFKELPNLYTALQLIEKESLVPTNDFMAELFGDGSSSPLVCGQFIEDEEDNNELKFVACTNDAATRIKELINFKVDTNQIQSTLRELIKDGEAFKTGFKKSILKENSCVKAALLNMLSFWDIYLALPQSKLGIYDRLAITGIEHNTFTNRTKRIYKHLNHNTENITNVLTSVAPLNGNINFIPMPENGTVLDFEMDKPLHFLNMGISTNLSTVRIALSTSPQNQSIAINALNPKKIMPITSEIGVERGALLFDAEKTFTQTYISYPRSVISGQKRVDIVNIVIPPYKQLSIANIFNGALMLDSKKKSTKALVDSANQSVQVNTTIPIVNSLILTLSVLELFHKDDIKKCIQCYRLILNPMNLDEIIEVQELDFSTHYKNILDAILGNKTYVPVPLIDRVGIRTALINSLQKDLKQKLIKAIDYEAAQIFPPPPSVGKSSLPGSLLIIKNKLKNNKFALNSITTSNLDTDIFDYTSEQINGAIQELKELEVGKALLSTAISIYQDLDRPVGGE